MKSNLRHTEIEKESCGFQKKQSKRSFDGKKETFLSYQELKQIRLDSGVCPLCGSSPLQAGKTSLVRFFCRPEYGGTC